MGLIADLGAGSVALDTAIFIYLIEEHPTYLSTVLPLFREADAGKRELVTSALTLMEVLVMPYRNGDRQVAEQYEAVLTNGKGIRLVDVTRDQLRAAAQLRAATGVRTPDALQLVAAISAGCTALVTNDRRLPPVPGIRVLQLGSYAEKASS